MPSKTITKFMYNLTQSDLTPSQQLEIQNYTFSMVNEIYVIILVTALIISISAYLLNKFKFNLKRSRN